MLKVRGHNYLVIELRYIPAVNAFVQDTEQFDDLTMLCLEYKGPASL